MVVEQGTGKDHAPSARVRSVDSRSMIDAFASELAEAERARQPIPPLSDREPPLQREHAYAVQLAVAEMRTRAGAVVVGKKVGLTSQAMQRLLGVDEPDFGHLFNDMYVADGATISMDGLIAPKIEPEIAFVMAERLPGKATTPHDVLRATSHLSPALEVVDSRIADWRISWSDTVADNGSSARFVVADRGYRPLGIDLADLHVSLERNGATEATGSMSEVLGNPLRAVCWLAAQLEDFGLHIEPGDVILPGSPLKAIDVTTGDAVRSDFGQLGSVSVRFE